MSFGNQPIFRDDPAPAVPPATPAVPPVAVAPSPRLTFTQLLVLMVVGAALVVGVLYARDQFAPSDASPTVAINTAKLARVFGPELDSAYGDGCLAAGAALAEGKSMADAQTECQAKFLASRTTAFSVRIMPELTRLIPAGAEPTTADQRAAVAAFFTGLGHSLKGSK